MRPRISRSSVCGRSRSASGCPLETVENVLRLYRDKCFDCNVRHFHEKPQEVDELLLGRYIERGAGRELQLHSAWILDATWANSKLNTEMEPLRFKGEQLIDYVKACAAKKGTVTFNLGIFQDGTIGPATLKQMQALRKAIRGR